MRGSMIGVRLFALAALMNFALPSMSGAQTGSADQYRAAGHKLYQAKNYGQAARYYLAAVKVNPSDAASYQGLGNCYYAYGKKKEALAYYQRASALQPGNAQLAQFVRNLQAQVGAGGSVPSAAPAAASNALSQGMAFFQQKQYAASIPYFNKAIQQNPNDYRGYYYAGYANYMTRNPKNAAFYFGVANVKQPNASIKAYADRLKAGLAPADQQWVDSMVARYTGTGSSVAAAPAAKKKEDLTFGVHILGGVEYVLSDPAGIISKAEGAGSVSLSGFTPSMVMFPEIQPFARFGDAFEINLTFGYFPVGLLSYTTMDFAPTYTPAYGTPDVWRYSFNTTVITVDLGGKILFGDKDFMGYLGLSGGISPISTSFVKFQMDPTNTSILATTDMSTADYTTMAISGQALLGFDISMGGGMSIGPYVGFRYLSATDFKNGADVLVVDQNTGAVGLDPNVVGQSASPNIPLGDPVEKLTLDFSGIVGGFNLTFSF